MDNAVLVIGRFNPPTRGHEAMLTQAVSVARAKKAQLFVFTTKTIDKKKNPLEVGTKLAYLRAAFPGITFSDVKHFFEALEVLNQQGITHLTIVAGSDRIPGYADALKRVIAGGIDGNPVSFENFDVVSLSRDPDSDDVTGASATKARKLAAEGNLEGFKLIAPTRLSDEQVASLFNSVREGIGLK